MTLHINHVIIHMKGKRAMLYKIIAYFAYCILVQEKEMNKLRNDLKRALI